MRGDDWLLILIREIKLTKGGNKVKESVVALIYLYLNYFLRINTHKIFNK